jgi:hypothetical protein
MKALLAAVLAAVILMYALPVDAIDGNTWMELYGGAEHSKAISVMYVRGIMEGLGAAIGFVAGEQPTCKVSASTVASMVSDVIRAKGTKVGPEPMSMLVVLMLDRTCPGSMQPLVKARTRS